MIKVFSKNRLGVSFVEILISLLVVVAIFVAAGKTFACARQLRILLGQQMTATLHAQRLVEILKSIEVKEGIQAVYITHFPEGVAPDIRDWIDPPYLPEEKISVEYIDDLPASPGLPDRPLHVQVGVRWITDGKIVDEYIEVGL